MAAVRPFPMTIAFLNKGLLARQPYFPHVRTRFFDAKEWLHLQKVVPSKQLAPDFCHHKPKWTLEHLVSNSRPRGRTLSSLGDLLEMPTNSFICMKGLLWVVILPALIPFPPFLSFPVLLSSGYSRRKVDCSLVSRWETCFCVVLPLDFTT
jgi:hypothetical protein